MNEWDPPDSAASRVFWQRASELLVVFSADGIIVECNPAWERLLCWTRTRTIGRPWTDFVHASDEARVAASPYPTADMVAHDVEIRYRCSDGSYRWLLWTAHRADECWYAIGRDMSARRWAANGLRRVRKRLASTWTLVDTPLLTFDDNAEITDVNAALCALTQRQRSELVGQRPPYDWLSIVPVPTGDAVLAELRRADQGRAPEAIEPEPVLVRVLDVEPGERLAAVTPMAPRQGRCRAA